MKHLLPVILIALASCSSAPKREPASEVKKAGSKPKITQFYATPSVTAPGDRVLLCYGVEGAQNLTLEPAVDRVYPALSRCVEANPKSTTSYTLRAEGSGGTDTTTITVTVDPKAHRQVERGPQAASGKQLIKFFAASQNSVPKGAPVTICYGVAGAASVTLTPPVRPVQVQERACFSAQFDATTTLVLTAKAADGVADSEKLTIQVQ